MDEWESKGLIHWPRRGTAGGFPRRRAAEPFDPAERSLTVPDVWTDIDRINQAAKERLGYPTQKPEALLERIVGASSNEGDLVLDPFCGCGTAVIAAQKLKRSWIGIDITNLAIALVRNRIRDTFGEKRNDDGKLVPVVDFEIIGEPFDLSGAEALAAQDPYQFQWWALGLVDARPVEEKKGSDRGIDGRLYFFDEPSGERTKQIILQVKAGHTGPTHVRDLLGTVEREKADIGVLITLQEPTKAMRECAASAGFYETPIMGVQQRYPKIQLLTVGQLLLGARIDYPAQTSVTFKKAPRAKRNTHRQTALGQEQQAGDEGEQ
jgi:hypothetical protein